MSPWGGLIRLSAVSDKKGAKSTDFGVFEFRAAYELC